MRIAIVGTRPPSMQTYLRKDIGEMLKVKSEQRRIMDLILDDLDAFIARLSVGTVVVSGGANGVDHAAASAARERGLEVVEHLPDYERYPGHVAPLERNKLIVADCEILHAWPSPWSRGTYRVIELAETAGKLGGVHKPREKA